MEAPAQNKIVGVEIAVAKAQYTTFEVNGKEKSGYIFKQDLVVDALALELYGVTMEAMLDCVEELEKMGSYEELVKSQGGDKGGYKATGLVVSSKKDQRVKLSVEFGLRWGKDSDAQWATTMENPLTFKWFVDSDNMDKEMGTGAVPERAVTPEELDLISKIREQTKEKKMESIQPVMEAVKSHKSKYISESSLDNAEEAATPQAIKMLKKSYAGPSKGVSKTKKAEYEEMLKHEKNPVKIEMLKKAIKAHAQNEAAEKDPGDGPIDYEADIVAPSWQKWTARGGKPKYLGAIELRDEDPDYEGRIQVYQATHDDHGNLPGIHLMDPDQHDIDDAIDRASRDGFGEIIIHGPIPPELKLEGKEIKGAIMREKRTFTEDCDDVDFFGLPKLEEKKPAGKKLGEAESTYSNKEKPAKAPLVQKDPKAYDNTVDKLDGSNKMRSTDPKPQVMGDGQPLAKPSSEVGKEYGEKEGSLDNTQVGEPGDDQGDVMQGKGKSDSQQKELPSAKIKLGKPGDDQGKVMADSRKRAGAMIRENSAMLRRKLPENGQCAIAGAKHQNKALQNMGDGEKRKQMMQKNASEARARMGMKKK